MVSKFSQSQKKLHQVWEEQVFKLVKRPLLKEDI